MHQLLKQLPCDRDLITPFWETTFHSGCLFWDSPLAHSPLAERTTFNKMLVFFYLLKYFDK